MTLAYSSTISSIRYRINNPEISITLNDWKFTPVECFTITEYSVTASYKNGIMFTEIPNLMRFDSATRTFTFYSTDVGMINKYEICFIAVTDG